MVRIKKGIFDILKKARTSVCNQQNFVSKTKQAFVEQTLGGKYEELFISI